MKNNYDGFEDIYSRTKIVIGEENLKKLKVSKVCICGIGGVGSFTLEALARIGVGTIHIIDKDVVDITNINRQIIADVESVGKDKVECAKNRVKKTNPDIDVIAIKETITVDNMENLIPKDSDYVIDAIDMVESKIAIIQYCKEKNIEIISSMGMANKMNPCDIKVSDISKTSVCPLAKIIRKKLREKNIGKLKVVYTEEQPIGNKQGLLGSVSFVPGVAGLVIASEVVKDIINKSDKQ